MERRRSIGAAVQKRDDIPARGARMERLDNARKRRGRFQIEISGLAK